MYPFQNSYRVNLQTHMEKYIDSKNLLATPFFNQKELPHRKFFRPLCSIVENNLTSRINIDCPCNRINSYWFPKL